MKRLLEPKLRIGVLAILGLLALGLLSVALRQLAFQPATPFSLDFSAYLGSGGAATGPGIPVWKIFLFGALLLLIMVLLFLLLDPQQRKRLLLQMLRYALIFGMVAWLLTNLYDRGILQNFLRGVPSGANSNPNAALPATAPVFNPPQVNGWLVYAVSFGIALGLVLFSWYLYSQRRKSTAGRPIDEVAEIAHQALSELETSGNWDDAIVRAYIRMNEVVMAERMLIRQPGSTPREFARRMEGIGLPGEAVRSLTGLFEAVRYGGKSSSLAERELAVAALNAILQACGRHS